MSRNPLSDQEAYELLHEAWLALGNAPGATVRADTALKAARRAMLLLQMGLLQAIDENSDKVSSVRDDLPPPPLSAPR